MSKAPTPFMAQYLEVKASHPDALLFFRMGDFYELFFSDAEIAASVLGITLTARGEHDGQPIPMAGVPYHAAEGYLARLIRDGHRVAICEQTESPTEAKKRGAKAVVRREVVRVVTPGTVTEDAILAPDSGQALVALTISSGREAALAACDVSTGRFDVIACGVAEIGDRLASLPVRELLVTERHRGRVDGLVAAERITERADRQSSPKRGEAALCAAFQVASSDAFGAFSSVELSAIGLLLDYLSLTQAGADIRLDPPRRGGEADVLAIDPATRASLEIDRDASGGRTHSLLSCIDRTRTAPGARRLAEHLARPSSRGDEITSRLDAVGFFIAEREAGDLVGKALSNVPDLERARGRLRLGRGGPRDLQAVGRALIAARDMAARLGSLPGELPGRLRAIVAALDIGASPDLTHFAATLSRALADEVPVLAREGGFIAHGFDAGLDAARALKDDSRQVLAQLQARYADETGIAALKVKFNNVLGYFIEVPARHGDTLMQPPLSEVFVHRQTLANAVRFSTAELSDLAGRISRAEDEALAREKALFDEFVTVLEALAAPVRCVCDAIADLDVALSHARWAVEVDAVRPEIADGPIFKAEGLRHPVVEAALRKTGGGFTPNDLVLDGEGVAGDRLLMVTGPNMAGKSTFLRQAALAVILAQAGSYVPARSFRFGLADRVFSRVGASDDLARGRSTFMVEMVETAAILNGAGPNAFVILDEVGRGTATWDGLAIAWACVEHLHAVNSCRTLFATHYHELTALADTLDHAGNVSIRAREWKGDLVFLHDVQPGPADKSYGVQVARLAGLPRGAVRRAQQVLKQLEAGPGAPETLPLFAAVPDAPEDDDAPENDKLRREIAATDPDTMSPREALDTLYRLRALLD